MNDPHDLRPKIVAANIRKVREYRNYTQDYLAAKLRISQNAYSKIELGYSKVTIDRLILIAILLEVEVKQLICIDHRVQVKLTPPEPEKTSRR